MDEGYDSEDIHRLIREDLHANSVIPIRSLNNEIIVVNTGKWPGSSILTYTKDGKSSKTNSRFRKESLTVTSKPEYSLSR